MSTTKSSVAIIDRQTDGYNNYIIDAHCLKESSPKICDFYSE